MKRLPAAYLFSGPLLFLGAPDHSLFVADGVHQRVDHASDGEQVRKVQGEELADREYPVIVPVALV